MTELFGTVLRRLAGEPTHELARDLAISAPAAERAARIAAAVLLASLAREAATPDGARALRDVLARDHDGSTLDDVVAALRNYEKGPGEALVRGLFAETASEVASRVASAAGLDEAKGATLLAMLAPVVYGVLGLARAEQGLDVTGLADALRADGEQLATAVPGGAAELATLVGERREDAVARRFGAT